MHYMFRIELINQLENSDQWDVCIIGGGATGLGIAVDAASRGFKTILVEQGDFAKGTSSRSTKLVHGGVRYLQHGNIRLVWSALRERGILKKNAGHLVKNLSFIVPQYKWWQGPYYGLGLKLYDWMSGSLGLGSSQLLSRDEVIERIPTIEQDGLRGGIIYHDGQFDDARLAINLAQTALEQGALMLNYFRVKDFLKAGEKIIGIVAEDALSGKEYEIKSKTVINATGVFSDSIQQMDEPGKSLTVRPSQGIHLVLDRSFLPGDIAIMVPQTDDGRVLFAVPWHNRVIVGTTETEVDSIRMEPIPLQKEVDFLLNHASRYLVKHPSYEDIKSMFAGLRPLIRAGTKKSADVSRDHIILQSASGLFSIVGGKWTTYRKMAEDVINLVISAGRLSSRPCITENLAIHGNREEMEFSSPGYYYGTDNASLEKLYAGDESLKELVHPGLPYTKGMVVHAVRNELAMTVEDVLSRRTRALLLDASAARAAAIVVAGIMRKELKQTDEWVNQQLLDFDTIASGYIAVRRQAIMKHGDS